MRHFTERVVRQYAGNLAPATVHCMLGPHGIWPLECSCTMVIPETGPASGTASNAPPDKYSNPSPPELPVTVMVA